jgi:hypothetical protein
MPAAANTESTIVRDAELSKTVENVHADANALSAEKSIGEQESAVETSKDEAAAPSPKLAIKDVAADGHTLSVEATIDEAAAPSPKLAVKDVAADGHTSVEATVDEAAASSKPAVGVAYMDGLPLPAAETTDEQASPAKPAEDKAAVSSSHPALSKRAAMMAKANLKKAKAGPVVTEKVTNSKRAARGKSEQHKLALKRAEEKDKAKVEAKRKEEEEAKEKAEAQKKLVDNVREELEKKGKAKKVQVINVHELEKTIPPMLLKYLPDDYAKLDHADKYRECKKSM